MRKSVNELNADLFGSGRDKGHAVDVRTARKKAMDLLARREHGREELIGRLKAKGLDEEVVAEAVVELAREGLQDDARFADSFVRSRAGRGTGPLRIRQALLEKGLSESLIARALDGLDIDWGDEARRVRVKKFGPAYPADFKDEARQMRFLQYRGFDHDQIRAAMDTSAE